MSVGRMDDVKQDHKRKIRRAGDELTGCAVYC